jgi:hypothetical protein
MSSVFEVAIIMDHVSVYTGVSKCSKLYWNCLLCIDTIQRGHMGYFVVLVLFRANYAGTGCSEWQMGRDWRVTCQPMALIHFLATGASNPNGHSK